MLPAEPLNQDQISSLLGIILEVVTPAGVVEGDWLLAGDQVDHHGCVKVVKGLQSLQVEACDLLKLNAALLPPLSLPNLCVAAGTALSSTPVPVRLILDSSIDLTILILTAQGLRFDIEVLGHRLTLWQCVI